MIVLSIYLAITTLFFVIFIIPVLTGKKERKTLEEAVLVLFYASLWFIAIPMLIWDKVKLK